MDSLRAGWLAGVDCEGLRAAALAGGERELNHFLNQLRISVLRVLSHRIDTDAAEDLTQTVLLTVVREWADVNTNFAAWLGRVTRNTLHDEYRRQRVTGRQTVRPDDIRHLPAADHFLKDAQASELRHLVSAAVDDACGPLARDVVLGLLDGHSVQDLADRSGVSVGTIRTRLARARAALRPVCSVLLSDSGGAISGVATGRE